MFKCSNCGAISIKWVGRCPECRSYGTMEPAGASPEKSNLSGLARFPRKDSGVVPVSLSAGIKNEPHKRIKTGIGEFDVSVGSGLVMGQSVLIGGDPGIGKSTLMLQVSERLAASGVKVIYISTEETLAQLLLRAERLKLSSENLLLVSLNDIGDILYLIEKGDFGFAVIDSIQRVLAQGAESSFGSVNSLREAANEITSACLKKNCGVFLVGHVTKEGNFAGPKTLEHIVDTVLYFDSGKKDSYRILRCYKNRFGSTDEIGVFEMRESGLSGVKNPSSYFIEERRAGSPGSVITACIEGSRPFLVEVQALVANSFMPYPKRVFLGMDNGRASIICAVLEKKEGIKLGTKEIYLKIFGGVAVQEPSIDLPAAVAIVSSYLDKEVPRGFMAFGEMGLTGEIRGVSNALARVKEAVSSGFTDIIIPESNLKDLNAMKNMKKGVVIHPVAKIKKIIEYLGQLK